MDEAQKAPRKVVVFADHEAPSAPIERLDEEDDFQVEPGDYDSGSDVDADVMILDQNLDDDISRELVRRFDGVVLLLSDAYSPDALQRTLDLDVDAFVQKSVPSSEIVRIIRQELKKRREGGAPKSDHTAPVGDIVGGSEPMRDVLRMLAKTAPSDLPVLVTGESGTGKELVSRAIHRLSPRRDGPFIAVNCGAIPENIIESELFGHEKGAFTGATEQRKGVFEEADGGTLFLDEIGELPLKMQTRLLRVLEDHRFERVGGNEQVDVDVRLVFATNRDLKKEVKAGRFREDLFYRIDVLRIEVPPLRDRQSDIETLWEHFVREAAEEEGRNYLETRTDVVRMLMRYDWPGNVRELRNLARQAVIRRSSGKITPRLVEPRLRSTYTGKEQAPASRGFVPKTLDEIERDAIITTYQAVDNVKEAAKILGISERKMYYRLKEYREAGYLGEGGEEGQRETILVAHPAASEFRRLVSDVSDYETVWVKTGVEVLESVHNDPPSAIIAAVDLPILDGINVLELAHEQSWDIPIMLVGEVDEAAQGYIDALGAATLLEPDVEPSTVAWVLDTALDD